MINIGVEGEKNVVETNLLNTLNLFPISIENLR